MCWSRGPSIVSYRGTVKLSQYDHKINIKSGPNPVERGSIEMQMARTPVCTTTNENWRKGMARKLQSCVWSKDHAGSVR